MELIKTQLIRMKNKEIIKKSKDASGMIDNIHLEQTLIKILKKLIAKEYRPEALNILLKSSKEKIGEFLYYYFANKSNIACLVIDSAKIELVKTGKMLLKKEDQFGHTFDFKE